MFDGATGDPTMAARPERKEFRTSVILTETQFKRVRDIARTNDASIAWVLRQALDRYLDMQGRPPNPRRVLPDDASGKR
ncbi:MAG: hypothetical protein AB1781_07090 [Pseudomonadota bacterium]